MKAEEFAVRTVCHDCAYKAGYVPKDKEVGVWIDTCDVCHQKKPCTDLVHDWKYEISKIANQESPNQESPSVMIEDRERGERTIDGFEVPKCEKIAEPLSFENFEVCFSANCETNIHKMNVFNKEIVSK